jgi:Mg-chelatase subunit ChlD
MATSRRSSLSVILLVDGSSSVTEDDFCAMKQFCLELVASLRQSHAGSRVAVLQFNQYPKVHVGLTAAEKQCLVTTIQAMDQMMGSTDIAAPIRRARQIFAEEENTTGEKAIVILTDGQTHSDELKEAEREARQAALDAGARLFALGVGRDVDESGLRRVASGTSDTLPSCPTSPMSTGQYFPLRKMNR